jgi:hypothetical protein
MGMPGGRFGGKRGGWGDTSDETVIAALTRAEKDSGAPEGQLRGIYAGEGRSGFVGDGGTSFNWGQFHLAANGKSMGNEMLRAGVDIYDKSPEGIYKQAMWVARMLHDHPGRISEFHGNRGARVGQGLHSIPNIPIGAGASPSVTTTHNQQHSSVTNSSQNHVGAVNIQMAGGNAYDIARNIREAMRREAFARTSEGGLA